SGATYWYQLVLTYTASNTGGGMGGGGLRWAWDVPTGTSMPRQTASYALVDNQAISLIAGGRILLRSPAATTEMRAEGSGPDNFHAVLEYGSIQVGGLSGEAVLQFAQWNAHSTPTTLRGATRTRVVRPRVQQGRGEWGMAVAEGAYRVRYNVSTVDGAPWLTWIFESALAGGAAKQVVDEALQMAAEHVINWLN